MSNKFHEIAFTDHVKQAQGKYGSRRIYEKMQNGRAVQNAVLSDAENDFIEDADGFYMATVGENDQPYIQFRGGPRGFLKILDEKTIAFADFRGNLQYISVGNLKTNEKAALFLMDYANRRRLKIFARVEIKDAPDAPELVETLRDENYEAAIERVFVFHVEAFDWNCPQHITPRYTIEQIRELVRPLNEHIERLEREIEQLKRQV